MSGMVAAYELMKLGLRPVVYEVSHMGGRLRSQQFEGAPTGVIAELGGMRFPVSSTSFYHYVDLLGLDTAPFPNPLTPGSNSTVIHIEGTTHYAEQPGTLPTLFQEVAQAWADALEAVGFTRIQDAIRARDVATLKSLWNNLVPIWDNRTFYDSSRVRKRSRSCPSTTVRCSVRSDSGPGDGLRFPDSMLEIFRVVMTNCDEDQRLIVGGAEQVPRDLWEHAPSNRTHWPAGTSLASLHSGGTRPGVARIAHADNGFEITDMWGWPGVIRRCSSLAKVGYSPPR